VGACSFLVLASAVSRVFMTDMNTLDRGGVMAMLR
jgi:hypothetical protein